MASYIAPESLHVGTGVETVFGFNWPYLLPRDLTVTLNGMPVPTVLASPNQVSVTPAPASGVIVRIYRNTPAQTPTYLFASGIPMLPRYIDGNNKQLLFALQEGLLAFEQTKATADKALAEAARANATADNALVIAQAANKTSNRAFLVDPIDPPPATVPSVAARRGKVAGFDGAGNLIPVAPVSSSALDLAVRLANGGTEGEGAAMVGWQRTPLRKAATTVQRFLDAQRLNIWEFAHLVTFKPDPLDPATWDWTAAVTAALAVGGDIEFSPNGTFRCTDLVATRPVRIHGNGAYLIVNSVRLRTSGFSVDNLRMTPPVYQSSARGIHCYAFEDGVDYSDISITNMRFSGYFYSTDFRARGYDAGPADPTNRRISDLRISGCTSTAPGGGVNAGHFQHIGCHNLTVTENTCYGGIGAASYNFINGNTYVKCSDNYDHDNTYASFELENSGVSVSTVTGNTFGGDLWVDDSSNVTISGNSVGRILRITSQTIGTDSITVSGNTCGRITATKFGNGPTQRMTNLQITGNTCTSAVISARALLLDDFVLSAKVSGNNFQTTDANGESVSINATAGSDIWYTLNASNGRVLIGGTQSAVTEYGNSSAPVVGGKAVHLSRLMAPNPAYLDLPGQYMYPGLYSGPVAGGATYAPTVTIPSVNDLACRAVTVQVLVRNVANNTFTTFKQDVLLSRVGNSYGSPSSEPYGYIGGSTPPVKLTATLVSPMSLTLTVHNDTASVLQVTLVLEVSSQMSEIA